MEQSPTPYEALRAAVNRIGSQSAMARLCGIGQPAVWKWLQSSKRIPAEYVLSVEAATGVSRHHLRPDIYPEDTAPLVAKSEPVACDPAPKKKAARA